MGIERDLLIGVALLLLIALVGWSVIGVGLQQRRVRFLARTLAQSLSEVGPVSRVRALGVGRMELRIDQPVAPFTSIRVVLWLQPMTFLPFWLFRRLRGERDVVGIGADLNRAPSIRFELVDPLSRIGQRVLNRARGLGWSFGQRDFCGRQLMLAAPDLPAAARMLGRIGCRGHAAEMPILRLAVPAEGASLILTVADPERFATAGPRLGVWLTRIGRAILTPGQRDARGGDGRSDS
ncbi:MAG TPA: hypothetical protein VKY56_05450 [Chloroflexota bacterium]|nr:hypothetical protein [Chloroflexota bacterium]